MCGFGDNFSLNVVYFRRPLMLLGKTRKIYKVWRTKVFIPNEIATTLPLTVLLCMFYTAECSAYGVCGQQSNLIYRLFITCCVKSHKFFSV